MTYWRRIKDRILDKVCGLELYRRLGKWNRRRANWIRRIRLQLEGKLKLPKGQRTLDSFMEEEEDV